MHIDGHDPEEYTPGPDPVTAREEYEPAPIEAGAIGEANPADLVEQSVEVPVDEPESGGDDDYDDVD